MMTRLTYRAAALAATAFAAGCAHSPKTTVLTLDAIPPTTVRTGYSGAPIAVRAVHLPPQLDRTQFVRQVGAGEVKIDDFAQWVAPPGLLARDALVRDLAARLPTGSVLLSGSSAGQRTAQALDVTIVSLDLSAYGASLQASYRSLPNGVPRQVSLSVSGPSTGPVAAARLFGALLGRLADSIAADLPR